MNAGAPLNLVWTTRAVFSLACKRHAGGASLVLTWVLLAFAALTGVLAGLLHKPQGLLAPLVFLWVVWLLWLVNGAAVADLLRADKASALAPGLRAAVQRCVRAHAVVFGVVTAGAALFIYGIPGASFAAVCIIALQIMPRAWLGTGFWLIMVGKFFMPEAAEQVLWDVLARPVVCASLFVVFTFLLFLQRGRAQGASGGPARPARVSRPAWHKRLARDCATRDAGRLVLHTAGVHAPLGPLFLVALLLAAYAYFAPASSEPGIMLWSFGAIGIAWAGLVLSGLTPMVRRRLATGAEQALLRLTPAVPVGAGYDAQLGRKLARSWIALHLGVALMLFVLAGARYGAAVALPVMALWMPFLLCGRVLFNASAEGESGLALDYFVWGAAAPLVLIIANLMAHFTQPIFSWTALAMLNLMIGCAALAHAKGIPRVRSPIAP